MRIIVIVVAVVLAFAGKLYAGMAYGANGSVNATGALAYIDPGVGSMIFQVLIAGVVASGFVIKIFWARIRSFFSGLITRGTKQESEQ